MVMAERDMGQASNAMRRKERCAAGAAVSVYPLPIAVEDGCKRTHDLPKRGVNALMIQVLRPAPHCKFHVMKVIAKLTL